MRIAADMSTPVATAPAVSDATSDDGRLIATLGRNGGILLILVITSIAVVGDSKLADVAAFAFLCGGAPLIAAVAFVLAGGTPSPRARFLRCASDAFLVWTLLGALALAFWISLSPAHAVPAWVLPALVGASAVLAVVAPRPAPRVTLPFRHAVSAARLYLVALETKYRAVLHHVPDAPSLVVNTSTTVAIVARRMRRVLSREAWTDTIDGVILVVLALDLIAYSRADPDSPVLSGMVDYVRVTPDFAWRLLAGLAFLLAVTWLQHAEDRMGKARKALAARVAVGTLVVFVLALFDDSLALDLNHYMPYVGPALHDIHGGIPMVDEFCQYGFLPWIVIRAAFTVLPASFGTAALIVRLINLAYFLTIALTIFAVTRRRVAAACVMVPVFLVGITFHANLANLLMQPSTTGMRYLVPALMVLTLTAAPARRWLAVAVLVLSSFWSLESFAFALAPWLAVLFLDCVRARRLGDAARTFAVGLAAVAAAHAAFVIGMRVATGELVDYQGYFSFFLTFRPDQNNEWTFAFDPYMALWVPVWLVFFLTIAAALCRALQSGATTDLANRLVPTAAFGIATLTYFIGRTTETTLGLTFLPFAVIMVAAGQSILENPGRFGAVGRVASVILIASGAYMVAFGGERFARPYEATQGNATVLRQCLSPNGCSPGPILARMRAALRAWPFDPESPALQVSSQTLRDRVDELVAELQTYAPNQPTANLVVETELMPFVGMTAAMQTGQWYAWGFSSPLNDGLSSAYADLIVRRAARVHDGEVIFVRNDRENLVPVEQDILRVIGDRCRLSLVDARRYHSVYRTDDCKAAP